MRSLTCLLLFACVSFVHAQEIGPADFGSGGLLLYGPAGQHLALALDTDVDINVSGLVARVNVRQTFKNESGDWVEGTYLFPLPADAAVDQMRLRIGQRFVEGEIQEKAKARATYEKARASGQKTSLVEQDRSNVFKTSVANIGPGESVTVEIEYLETLRYDAGRFALRFPLTITPRFRPAPDPAQKGFVAQKASLAMPPMLPDPLGRNVSIRAYINAGMPLDVIASRYHPITTRENNGRYEVRLAGDRAPMDHDFELLWRPESSSSPRAMSFSEMVDGEPHYLLMVVPPDNAGMAPARIPREMLFIIDTSGSMHGNSIEQARNALSRALDTLQPGDLFNVIEFNSSMRPFFGNSMDANPMRVEQAKRMLATLVADGGTNMAPALHFALLQPDHYSHLRQVVFITDGAVDNEESLFSLIEQHLGSARLFTVGIGSAPNSWFMRRSAELGKGTFTMIAAAHELAEKMDRLFARIESPQARNIDVDWPGAVEMYPSSVPDLYAGEPVLVRLRATAAMPAGSTVRVSGETAGGGWLVDVPVDHNFTSFGVGALWARAKITDLFDQQRRGADADLVRAEVVRTSLKHHIVSRFTSLVAVDRTPSRTAADKLTRESVPNALPRGASMTAFPATATPAAQLRIVGLCIVAFALLLLAWQRQGIRHARVR